MFANIQKDGHRKFPDLDITLNKYTADELYQQGRYEELFFKILKFSVCIARPFLCSKLTEDDIEMAVYEAFSVYITKFDVTRGYKFLTGYRTVLYNQLVGCLRYVKLHESSPDGIFTVSLYQQNDTIDESDILITDVIEDTTVEEDYKAVEFQITYNKMCEALIAYRPSSYSREWLSILPYYQDSYISKTKGGIYKYYRKIYSRRPTLQKFYNTYFK